MSKSKILRDSIHGYIEIDDDITSLIIDTKYFQRLRRIEQTSMRCLYPAARHDRFIHSIGTYHLARVAFKAFKKNLEDLKKNNEVFENIQKFIPSTDIQNSIGFNFEIASLLHDVGHSPFSHTLENYFKYETVDIKDENVRIPRIEKELFDELNKIWQEQENGTRQTEFFLVDFKCSSPSPHEIVSSIVLLKCFSDNLTTIFHKKKYDLDLEFMVRAIMGITYSSTHDNAISLKNCFIKLLNSSSIDVDKVDFITRDSQVSGYDNVIVDTNRLLNAISPFAYKNKKDEYELILAFNKTALSVIQNVVMSRNSLYTWIYSHHKVKYEAYLIEESINTIAKIKYPESSQAQDKFIFKTFCTSNIIDNLFCDDDIWCLLKEHKDHKDIKEIFERSSQKAAIWKSYAEFKSYFHENDKDLKIGDFSTDNLRAIANAKEGQAQKEFLEYLRKYKDLNIDFGIIPTSIKLSTIEHNAILIILNDRLYGFDVLLNELHQNYSIKGFFYIYCDNKLKQQIDKDEFVNYIKAYPSFRLIPPSR